LKPQGGILMDVPSGEIAARGLSMPHSPRWHDGRLWLLESGTGRLLRMDMNSGKGQAVAELPGFARGLALIDPNAFIGRGGSRVHHPGRRRSDPGRDARAGSGRIKWNFT
jgi:uncharacterized protein (TIGR03032 family)